jgi:hypothetical protein
MSQIDLRPFRIILGRIIVSLERQLTQEDQDHLIELKISKLHSYAIRRDLQSIFRYK